MIEKTMIIYTPEPDIFSFLVSFCCRILFYYGKLYCEAIIFHCFLMMDNIFHLNCIQAIFSLEIFAAYVSNN